MSGMIDELLVDIVERGAQRVQVWTGYDCLRQAQFSWLFAVEEVIRRIAHRGLSSEYEPLLFNLVDAALILMWGFLGFLGGPYDDIIRHQSECGLKNFQRNDWLLTWARYVFALLVAANVGERSINVGGLLATWLSACTPLPAAGSKLGAWLKSIFRAGALRPAQEAQ